MKTGETRGVRRVVGSMMESGEDETRGEKRKTLRRTKDESSLPGEMRSFAECSLAYLDCLLCINQVYVRYNMLEG